MTFIASANIEYFWICFGRFCGGVVWNNEGHNNFTKIRLNYVKELLDDVTVQIAAKEIQDEETILVVQEMRWVADVLLLSLYLVGSVVVGVITLSLLPTAKNRKAQRLDNLISGTKNYG